MVSPEIVPILFTDVAALMLKLPSLQHLVLQDLAGADGTDEIPEADHQAVLTHLCLVFSTRSISVGTRQLSWLIRPGAHSLRYLDLSRIRPARPHRLTYPMKS